MRTLLRKMQLAIGAGAALSAPLGLGCAKSHLRSGQDSDARVPVVQIDAASTSGQADSSFDAMFALRDASSLHDTGSAQPDAFAALDAFVTPDAWGQLSDAAIDAAGLAPYPIPYGCGPCCYRVVCFTYDDDRGCLPATDPRLMLGLHGCDVQGPFASNPADPQQIEGDCCYLDGEYSGFDGRPLFVEHRAVVAPVIARGDWLV